MLMNNYKIGTNSKSGKKSKAGKKPKDPYNKVAIIVTIIFGIYALMLVLPFAWGFMTTLKSGAEYFWGNILPKRLLFSNYVKAFTALTVGENNLYVMIINSLWYTLGNTIASMLICTITAYACAKYDFFLGKLCFWLSLMVMIIPVMGNLPASFRLAKILNTYDTPFTLVASFGGIGFTMLILSSFFKGLDKGYAEAAFIDGANHFQVFFKVMLPQAKAPILALSMSSLIGLWCDAEGPLVFLPSYPTLATGLYVYQIEAARTLNYPVLFAGLFMSAVPSVLLYVFLSKNIMSLQFDGAFKG